MNPILKTYFPIADIIAGEFGNQCEVVVHDLSQPESSVVYVANGKVTGRKIGQSFDHLIKYVLLNREFINDRVMNYRFVTEDGRTIKASSAMIRDGKDQVIGMICINYDITLFQTFQSRVNEFLNEVNSGTLSDIQKPSGETEASDTTYDVETIINNLISDIIGKPYHIQLTRKQCIEKIKFMDEKGIFLVKGAIEKVANIMGVSKVTIYSYLDEARGKRERTE